MKDPFYKKYPLYFQKFRAKFTLKEKHIPCLAKKLSFFNKAIKSDKDLRNKEIILTNIDFKHFLINYDVHEIECLGLEFDPHVAEAVLTEHDENKPENVVLEVLTKGYKYKDKVIRHAMVKVSE